MSYDTTFKEKSKIKQKEKINVGEIILTLSIFCIFFAILTDPTLYAQSVTNGLKLFAVAVLPGLLPFMFLTKILTNLGTNKTNLFLDKSSKKIFGLNGNTLYAFFISILSGYPVGAKLVSDLYKQNKIKEYELLKASLICSTSGPIFIIGSVGVFMHNNIKIGICLYVINIASSIISVLLIHAFTKKRIRYTQEKQNRNILNSKKEKQNLLKTITRSANDTASSLLIVAFYISFFYMFIQLLCNLKIIPFLSDCLNIFIKNKITSSGFISGIIEMTRGIQIISAQSFPFSLSLISFLLSFSGFSIVLQSLSFLNDTPIQNKKFILGKLLQGLISFVISIIIFSIL